MELRRCEPEQVPVLLRLLEAWGAPMGPFDDEAAARSLLELTRAERAGLWLVRHHGEPVGYAVVGCRPPRGFLWQEASLDALFLVPAVRGTGIGRVVRRVLGELLAGQGCALLVEPRVHEDRHWPGAMVPAPAVAVTAA